MALEQPNQSLTPIKKQLIAVNYHNLIFLDPNSQFGKAASSTIGRFITKPMTRDEACKILNMEEQPELNHAEILEVLIPF